jgi:hypothetical protein
VATEGPIIASTAISITCTYRLVPPLLGWTIHLRTAQTAGAPPSSVAYHLQQAFQVPVDYANLTLAVTDSQGKPVSYLPSPDVTAKVQALHPAAPGYVWVGYQSAEGTDPGSGGGSSSTYSIHVSFVTKDPATVTGATWSSSDADVLSNIAVVEGYSVLGLPAVQSQLGIVQSGGQVQLSWSGPGVLQLSSDPNGPWTDSPNQNNPQTLQTTEARKFFSLRQ